MERIGPSGMAPPAVCAVVCAALALTSWALAQEVAPTTQPEVRAPATAHASETPATDVNINERGTVELHVQGADLRRVLQLLSTQSRTNIVATKEVQGTVTADLYGVTFAEALDAVLKSAGFGYQRQGNFIYVYTQEQLTKLKAAERELSVRVFKLNYVTAADAKTLITPAMSTEGTVALTPAAAVGTKASKEDAGGNSQASEDLIVVRDYPDNLEKITAILKELDVRPQQVLIEATILRASLTENTALGIDFNTLSGIDFKDTNLRSFTAANSVVTGTGGINPGGLTMGIVQTIENGRNGINFIIRALEDITDTAVLANPKLLVLNKQRGEVLVGRRDGYITSTISETTTTQTVQFLETGTKLVVRPYIMGDGHIRLEIHPENSEGTVSAQGLPSQETTECTSNILVKDGHTIVISGLFKESTAANHRQVPLLGNVPIAGALFRRRVDDTKREEVIILITPHILKQPSSEMASEQLKDQVERFRIGMRQGLMWFGRDRLSQLHMRWARDHLARGATCMALWDTEMALSLEPKMEEAIRLKERLTKQAIWANESRLSSAHYIVQQMIMQELGQPLEKVVPPDRPRDSMELDKDVRDAFGIGPRAELPLFRQPSKALPCWLVKDQETLTAPPATEPADPSKRQKQ